MSAGELIVPVEVHALVVNLKVRGPDDRPEPTYRVRPDFWHMLGRDEEDGGRGTAEDEAFQGGSEFTEKDEGVIIQWQLPEALTDGFVNPVTDETCYPLVPNRWLVVRYAQVHDRDQTKIKGWIVHSDYLYNEDPDLYDDDFAINSFLDPRADTPREDFLGRLHDLGEGPWSEAGFEGRELFLTAIGSGLPLFAAYQPYHENVFSLHDDLQDLTDRTEGDSYPPDATVSYLAMGWYSDTTKDILRTAAEIPSLLPPGSDGSIADVIAALGWTPAPAPVATCTIPGHGEDTPEAGPVEQILDGRDDTWFQTATPVTDDDYITVDLGLLQRVTAVAATFGEAPGGGRMAPAKKLLASADGAAWTPLGVATASEPDLTWQPGPNQQPLTTRYLRLQWTESSTYSTVVRTLTCTATPTAGEIERTVFSGTALGLVWERFGDARKPLDRIPNIAVGHSTGEAATAMFNWQARSADDAQLFSALYHGTLDTFDGAEGERDLAETTHRSWFSGSEGGSVWQIHPRPGAEKDPETGPDDLTPRWLVQLNADQADYDSGRAVLTDRQWRLWALHWLYHLPRGERPPGLPDSFDDDCDYQLKEEHSDGLAAATRAQLDLVADLYAELPPIGTGAPATLRRSSTTGPLIPPAVCRSTSSSCAPRPTATTSPPTRSCSSRAPPAPSDR